MACDGVIKKKKNLPTCACEHPKASSPLSWWQLRPSCIKARSPYSPTRSQRLMLRYVSPVDIFASSATPVSLTCAQPSSDNDFRLLTRLSGGGRGDAAENFGGTSIIPIANSERARRFRNLLTEGNIPQTIIQWCCFWGYTSCVRLYHARQTNNTRQTTNGCCCQPSQYLIDQPCFSRQLELSQRDPTPNPPNNIDAVFASTLTFLTNNHHRELEDPDQ